METSFNIYLENNKNLNIVLKKMNDKFENNIQAQRLVTRKFKILKPIAFKGYKRDGNEKLKYNILNVYYMDLFPSFKQIANYLLFINFIFSFFLGIIYGIKIGFNIFLISLFTFILLNLLDILRKPSIMYLAVKKGLKKNGYKGYIKYGGKYGSY